MTEPMIFMRVVLYWGQTFIPMLENSTDADFLGRSLSQPGIETTPN